MRMCDWSSDVCSSDLRGKSGSGHKAAKCGKLIGPIVGAVVGRDGHIEMIEICPQQGAVLVGFRAAGEARSQIVISGSRARFIDLGHGINPLEKGAARVDRKSVV